MSIKKEDYVKVLFDLGGRNKQVPNKKIADRLIIAPPTVTEMMMGLEKTGWVKYTPYKGSVLTEEGAARAKELIYKHRIWEVFLVNELGFDVEDVHEEAEKLEHATSMTIAERLDKYLDYPEYCPHGGAIPMGKIDIQEEKTERLSDVEHGRNVVVSRVVNEGKLVSYFKKIHVSIGDELVVTDYDSILDLLNVKNNSTDKELEISGNIAQFLFVEYGINLN